MRGERAGTRHEQKKRRKCEAGQRNRRRNTAGSDAITLKQSRLIAEA
jgi:hypothetical protein